MGISSSNWKLKIFKEYFGLRSLINDGNPVIGSLKK